MLYWQSPLHCIALPDIYAVIASEISDTDVYSHSWCHRKMQFYVTGKNFDKLSDTPNSVLTMSTVRNEPPDIRTPPICTYYSSSQPNTSLKTPSMLRSCSTLYHTTFECRHAKVSSSSPPSTCVITVLQQAGIPWSAWVSPQVNCVKPDGSSKLLVAIPPRIVSIKNQSGAG